MAFTIPLDNRILYYARDRATFGFLSHFHFATLEIDGESWPTVEHFYQAQKSFDPAFRAAIRAAPTPGLAKLLASPPSSPGGEPDSSWFRKNGTTPRQDWHAVKLEIMRGADLAKYQQHPDLCSRLCETGTSELIEDAATEPFWGWGLNGSGLNWAGRILMEVRTHLRGLA